MSSAAVVIGALRAESKVVSLKYTFVKTKLWTITLNGMFMVLNIFIIYVFNFQRSFLHVLS